MHPHPAVIRSLPLGSKIGLQWQVSPLGRGFKSMSCLLSLGNESCREAVLSTQICCVHKGPLFVSGSQGDRGIVRNGSAPSLCWLIRYPSVLPFQKCVRRMKAVSRPMCMLVYISKSFSGVGIDISRINCSDWIANRLTHASPGSPRKKIKLPESNNGCSIEDSNGL